MTVQGADDRARAVRALIGFERPLDGLIAELAVFPWDWEGEPLGIVGEPELASALRAWSRGELPGETLFTWATALEVRDDVNFASVEVSEAVHALANPDLQTANFIDGLAARFTN